MARAKVPAGGGEALRSTAGADQHFTWPALQETPNSQPSLCSLVQPTPSEPRWPWASWHPEVTARPTVPCGLGV